MTSPLILTPNLDRPDDVYAELLAAHDGLTKAQSDALNARLILILANHIGDQATFIQALTKAKGAGSNDRPHDGGHD
ncbi:DUF2783 domain-containing protein [Phaeobacter sp. B1627]|uniref:DUF2783 domain-containing protein n=1 Tax=Phaeobacter sp. B1627 TaxID=2583809 RepID=UPI00111A0EDE|nr:DUF2783 domain-containing protein [Phaeobacter sp. B1627]TNJ41108.1 DUF2783 domain-containing protein [Phaeobacter sp. B1627]